MLTFVLALMLSIGQARTVHNPQILVVAALISMETFFSLRQKA